MVKKEAILLFLVILLSAVVIAVEHPLPDDPYYNDEPDEDDDGINDLWEEYYFGDKNNCDPNADDDGDGLTNLEEYLGWTVEYFDCNNTRVRYRAKPHPRKADADDDGLDDFGERLWDKDPNKEDTDGDGLIDGKKPYKEKDPCNKHCNNFCIVYKHWKDIVCDECGDFCTYTPGGWGSKTVSEPGALRDMHFSTVFPSGMVLGSMYKLTLSSAQDVENFLPSGGKPSALTTNLINPGKTYKNVFAGHLVYATLSVEFNKAGYLGSTSTLLEYQIITSGPGAGMTVGEVLEMANKALGGEATLLTVNQLYDILSELNENFVDCITHHGFLECPEDGYDDMLEDYLWKINHLSSIFNTVDILKQNIIFKFNDEWKYDDSNTDFSDSWTSLSYDDSGWNTGKAYLGYGDYFITTNLNYGSDPNNKIPSYYFRGHFNIPDVNAVDDLEFNIDYDDGFIAYLNGNEVARSSGTSDVHSSYCTYHDSTPDGGPGWDQYDITSYLSSLQNGNNVLAVEIHQSGPTSSDIALAAYLANYETIQAHGLLEDLDDMCQILSAGGNPEDDLKRELLILWLNVVSANICYKEDILHDEIGCEDIPADTIEELLAYAENVLINEITSEYAAVYYYLWLINNGYCLDCTDSEPPPPQPQPPNFCTYTQGGWGSKGVSQPGELRDMYFSTVFPSGLVVGSINTLTLSTAKDVENFLPSGGTPRMLATSLTNPGKSYKNTFAGQLVAATLNAEFNKAGYLGINAPPYLEDLYLYNGPAAGLTIGEVLEMANQALGGGSTSLSINQLNDILTFINEKFNKCKLRMSIGALPIPATEIEETSSSGGGGGSESTAEPTSEDELITYSAGEFVISSKSKETADLTTEDSSEEKGEGFLAFLKGMLKKLKNFIDFIL
ncbi:hypothetical protein KY332_05235 [Candidatus Woesearchaeota archaeon]|nr:hypothetical protein [Candidatus Woesearchaeota archaeon]